MAESKEEVPTTEEAERLKRCPRNLYKVFKNYLKAMVLDSLSFFRKSGK